MDTGALEARDAAPISPSYYYQRESAEDAHELPEVKQPPPPEATLAQTMADRDEAEGSEMVEEGGASSSSASSRSASPNPEERQTQTKEGG